MVPVMDAGSHGVSSPFAAGGRLIEDMSAPIEGALGEETRFHDLLNELRSGLVELGSLALDIIRRAGVALVENRMDEVTSIQASDQKIDGLYAELNWRVYEGLSLRQPVVARDLRFFIAASRILYEIERSAKLGMNLVVTMDRVDGVPRNPQVLARLEQLVEAASAVFEQGVEALATMDPDIAERAGKQVDVADDLAVQFFTSVTAHQDDVGLDAAIALFYIGRFLERIADHGVVIAQNVTFAVSGEAPGTG